MTSQLRDAGDSFVDKTMSTTERVVQGSIDRILDLKETVHRIAAIKNLNYVRSYLGTGSTKFTYVLA